MINMGRTGRAQYLKEECVKRQYFERAGKLRNAEKKYYRQAMDYKECEYLLKELQSIA